MSETKNEWVCFKDNPNSRPNKCLDCGCISVNWSEKNDDNDTDDFDANNIYCPECHSSLYFIATDKEMGVM